MILDYTSRGHFEQRAEEYLRHYDELADLTDEELVAPFTDPIARVTLLSGETYLEVELNGVEYGLGYQIVGDTAYIKTAISPLDIERARTRSFRCKREVLA